MVAKRTESHPPPFPVSSLDGPMDRRTHGQTDPWPYPPPHPLLPPWVVVPRSVFSHRSLYGQNPPTPHRPLPSRCAPTSGTGCVRVGGGKEAHLMLPPPLSFPTPPKGTRRVGPGAGTLSLHGPLPCPPPPGFPTTHTHASIPPAMCVPMQEAMRPPPRSCPPLPPIPPPPQAVPPPPADSVYMTQCVSCRSYSLVYGD